VGADLAADLADAGVRYLLVDDRHFLVSGFERDRLHAPFLTESGGKRVALFPIDERLRYLIPFRPPAEIAAYLRELRSAGRPLAVFVDDGEKFGGWPGTKDWVYTRGWLAQFCDAIAALVAAGEVRLTTPGAALREVASAGLAYLPTASYREMKPGRCRRTPSGDWPPWSATWGRNGWRARRRVLARRPLAQLPREVPEANRMHKKMLALSALCHERGTRRRASRHRPRQCNDAYWHGVFGDCTCRTCGPRSGATWRSRGRAAPRRGADDRNARSRRRRRRGAVDPLGSVSALVSPRRGGVIENTRCSSGASIMRTC